MGTSLPKDLLNAERTKMNPVEGIYLRKRFEFESFRYFENDDNWEKVAIRIHQARLECRHNDEVEVVIIDSEFLLIHQNSSNREVAVALMAERKIWKIQSSSIRDFLDLTTCIIHSKVPTWSISPLCQVCSQEFTLGIRKHHCRNCGKCTCKKCINISDFNIEGFYRLTKVCQNCLFQINSQILIIKEIHRNEIIRGDSTNRSLLLPCPSRKSY